MKLIDPAATKRAKAYEMWTKSPMPMVTLFKTYDVTPLVRFGRRHKMKFNMLMCWCIGRAAASDDLFKIVVADNGFELYDKIAVNIVVPTAEGGITTCDIPYTPDLAEFNRRYLENTAEAYRTCADVLSPDHAIIGASSLAKHYIDGAVNQYSGIYKNVFMAWGRYRKRFPFRNTLPVSMQFHHAHMDGNDACEFLDRLQDEIRNVKKNARG